MTDEEFLVKRDNIEEEWRQVILKGEKQNYDVSNIGRIRNHATKELYKLSKTNGMMNTYEFIQLKLNDGSTVQTGIHRLVGIMFLPVPKKYIKAKVAVSDLVIDHIDNVKYHNIYTNLQWLTSEENLIKYYTDPLNIKSMHIPDHKVRKICEDLCRGLTIYDISKKYNYSEDAIYRIRYKMAYRKITRMYDFPSNQMTEEEVHKVCSLLASGHSINEVHEETGISVSKITRISNGQCWNQISKNYVFPNQRVVTAERRKLIIQICELLQSGKSPAMVANELELSKPFVQHIANRETHTDISKDYVFNYDKCKVADEVVHNICKDLESKDYIMKEIAKRNNVSTTFVKDIKYRKHRLDISKNYNW